MEEGRKFGKDGDSEGRIEGAREERREGTKKKTQTSRNGGKVGKRQINSDRKLDWDKKEGDKERDPVVSQIAQDYGRS